MIAPIVTTDVKPEARASSEAHEVPEGRAPEGRPSSPAGRSRSRESPGPRWAAALLAIALFAINAIGAPYYLAPTAVRVRHPLHAWLKPSGYVGQSLGLVAIALFLFLWLYPIRKKYGARLSFTGRLPAWLNWHVAAGLTVPWIAATHAGWRFTGLIGLGYAAMFIVYLSGLVGRYLYARIPRRRTGAEMSRDEVAAERERLLFELTAETGLSPSAVRELLHQDKEERAVAGWLEAARRMIADDWNRRRASAALAKKLSSAGGARRLNRVTVQKVVLLARREMALRQQIRMLAATQRAFGLWHAFHKPVAITALIAVLAHVVVAVAVGATWFH